MPSKSPAQAKLMNIAAHTKGGYGGVPQKVGKEFHAADKAKAVKGHEYLASSKHFGGNAAAPVKAPTRPAGKRPQKQPQKDGLGAYAKGLRFIGG